MAHDMTVTEREHRTFLQTYKRLAIEVDHADGMYVHTTDGRRYLDFLGGIAVNTAGHSHPRVIDAIQRQLGRYMHVSNYFYQDAQVEFVERLCAVTGYARAFLSNSGAEANEGAMKFARSHGSSRQKREVIGFSGGFHGRTYGVLSIMDKPLYKEGMGPFVPDTRVLPFNDVNALREAIGTETSAVFVEFLQGEGGVRWATKEFIVELFRLRDEFSFLIIADEVQTGGGRTGRFAAFEHFGVRPDIVTLAKGIGGGLPLGAMLVSEELSDVWTSGRHGTTFGGNAVACAAGSVILDLIQEGLGRHAGEVGDYMMTTFQSIASETPHLVRDVRGAGAIAGMELSVPAAPYVERMLERNVIINATAETVLRFLPPLIFTKENVDEVAAALRMALAMPAP